MTVFTEGKHREEFLLTESRGSRSRETVLFGSSVDVGQILGELADGALTAVSAAKVGNTGNGILTLANPAVAAESKPGVWRVIFDAAVVNAGDFEVFDPDGEIDGAGKVGVPYAGRIKFAIADGAADFVIEDEFDITVTAAAASGTYMPLNLAGLDGSEKAAAISCAAVPLPAGSPNVAGVIMARDCEVMGLSLEYPVGATAPQITAINVSLAKRGIIVRYPQGTLVSA